MLKFQPPTDEALRDAWWCIVFDSRDGRVVHEHQFIGSADPDESEDAREEHARAALRLAEQHGELKYLRVMHPPRGFRLEPRATIKVDLDSGKLVTTGESESSRQDPLKRIQKSAKSKRTLTRSKRQAKKAKPARPRNK